jgi:glycosyltransferase involved in cell wall biosynthesis
VTTVHDLTTARFNNPAKNWFIYRFKQLVYRRVIKRVAKKSRQIITASEYVKNDLVNFSRIDPDKVTVIYEAADKIMAESKPLAALEGKNFIMYVGRPTPHKNLERLIEAFSTLHANNPHLRLVLAGKVDKNYERIKEMVGQEAFAESIIFTGFVSEGQLRWLYEHTAAYIFPSLSEGFGLPGLEAMIHGAPVVSSNATCLPEIYGQAAHYFNPLDVEDMASKINDVLSDSDLRAHLIKKGHVRAAKYSWSRTAEQTLAVYKKSLI